MLPHARQQSSLHPPLSSTLKCLHGDLHGSPSARQLSRSVSRLSTSQTCTAGRGRAGLGRRWSGAPAWLKCASLIPMAGWFPGSLVPSGSHQSPQNGGPSHSPTSSRSARDWLMTSQSDATAPVRSAATQVGPLLSLGQLRQSHPISAISGPGSHSQLQVHRSPRRHWLADWVGERASASAMACCSIAIRKG